MNDAQVKDSFVRLKGDFFLQDEKAPREYDAISGHHLFLMLQRMEGC